jgi:hypothetical protein
VAEKSQYYTTPCIALWGDGGSGVLLYGSENLKKRELHLNYHQKHTENGIFNEIL